MQISSDPALGGNPHATTFGRVYPVGLPRRSPACPGGLDGGANDPRLAPYLDLVRSAVGAGRRICCCVAQTFLVAPATSC